MAINDTIADMLTRIRNAKKAEHKYVDVILTKMNVQIATVLCDQGFVHDFKTNDKEHKLRVFLKFGSNRQSVIQTIKRVSKCGHRRYVKCGEIPYVLGGLGIAIMTTPQGVMDGESARKKRLGGELICYVT
ncbi:MAG: 30S ribosomal protein S8 [Simkaniaceae bacterium]|nr:30S ribosomal protein S8 [Simkaniaceae bacterium]